jgi:hypothetical protein
MSDRNAEQKRADQYQDENIQLRDEEDRDLQAKLDAAITAVSQYAGARAVAATVDALRKCDLAVSISDERELDEKINLAIWNHLALTRMRVRCDNTESEEA